jgi:peroxiredoxin
MPIDVGQKAPDFALPAANKDGSVSLADYRGRPLLLALFRGLYCPFCRHQIANLARTAEKLRAGGVETLGIVATPPERARLYFRFRQAAIPLAADPELTTHRAYGLPGTALTPELLATVDGLALDYAKAQGVAVKSGSAYGDLNAIDGYQPSSEDMADLDRHQAQFIGQFLIDRDGMVRWVNIERAPGEFPTESQLLALVERK